MSLPDRGVAQAPSYPLTNHLQYAICAFVSDPSLTPASLEDAAIQRAERHLRVLAELAEIGLDLARALRRRVEAQARTWADEPPPTTERDPADAFQRLSRSVRLTVALEARVSEALRALIAGEAADARTTARRADKARARHRETVPARPVIVYCTWSPADSPEVTTVEEP